MASQQRTIAEITQLHGASGGLELGPTGLTLGGVALLERGALGFAPRRSDELLHLLRHAYGQHFDARRRVSGLKAVANAFNDGAEVCAIIAALHLRLPPLDAISRAALRSADRLIKAGYDPNQPRVPAGGPEGGQWSGGNGESGGASAGGRRADRGSGGGRRQQLAQATAAPSAIANIPGYPASVSPVPNPQIRGQDGYGDGRFGARRGSRRHQGIDLVALPGTPAASPADGTVTTVFDPYRSVPGKSGLYMAVQIRTDDGYTIRVLYLDPSTAGITAGSRVRMGDPIGTVQDLSIAYPPKGSRPDERMTNHVHIDMQRGPTYDARRPSLDPTPIVRAWRVGP